MKATLVIFVVCILLTSCRTTKIAKNATVYRIDNSNNLQAYKVTGKYTEDFTPNADNIIVLDSTDPSLFTKTGSPVKITPDATIGKDVLDNFFFGDVSGLVKVAKKSYAANDTPWPDFEEKDNLPYWKDYLVLQALSVPYKIRSGLTGTQYPNGQVYNTVETGFTANLSLGYKFSWNTYSPNKDKLLGLNTYSFSITPGVFAGLGTTSISNTNTINLPSSYGTSFSRSALTKSFGFFTLVGVSRFGFGYAGGFDYVSGPGGSNWIYKGRWWNGIALSIDLVNF